MERGTESSLQIADEGFTLYRRAIGQRIPRPKLQPVRLGECPNAPAVFGADFQVIVQQRCLTIEQKRSVRFLLLHQLDQMIETIHQAHARPLKFPAKFPVPMRIRYQIDLAL